ncbi:MAG: F0F1 ATP synthase subunit epsilon [Bacteroidota bacterium]|nr:F0F1 ATP synthase subunit epsilon [Bacteroidota bacterium]
MKVDITTPDNKLFSGEANLVQLPGLDGSFEILNHHAPMVSVLGMGKIKVIDTAKNVSYYEIKKGIVQVLNNTVVVLAE